MKASFIKYLTQLLNSEKKILLEDSMKSNQTRDRGLTTVTTIKPKII